MSSCDCTENVASKYAHMNIECIFMLKLQKHILPSIQWGNQLFTHTCLTSILYTNQCNKIVNKGAGRQNERPLY